MMPYNVFFQVLFRESNFKVRESGLQDISRTWLAKFDDRGATTIFAYTSRIHALRIGGKYFRVLLNSRLAPDSQNSRK